MRGSLTREKEEEEEVHPPPDWILWIGVLHCENKLREEGKLAAGQNGAEKAGGKQRRAVCGQ